ncbi:MAG TPA: hypothetical protein VEW46_19115 [Pyrinomonadaceae bacterium]|nr:hypothetical protein [Pyrinomonadaceae bacterium]
MPMFSGWIHASQEDGPLLESLGVVLGFYDDQFEGFEDCSLGEKALANLHPFWGQFIWHFKPVENLIPQSAA